MRWLIIGGILALVLTVYALVDLTVTDDRRIRTLNRVLWVVLIVVLPVLGAAAWLTWGKAPRTAFRPVAPDDDPAFGGRSSGAPFTDAEADRRIAELEAELAAIDAEIEQESESVPPTPDAADGGADAQAPPLELGDTSTLEPPADDDDPSAPDSGLPGSRATPDDGDVGRA